LEKKEHGKEFLFFAGSWKSNSPGFLEMEIKKKGTQKGMHNLVSIMRVTL
jgi:hypothetical protein